MRKITYITTQDHLLFVVEVDEENNELLCFDTEEQVKEGHWSGRFPTELVWFCSEGELSLHAKEGSGDWESTYNIDSPFFGIISADVRGGSIPTSVPYCAISMVPKESSVAEIWKNTTNEMILPPVKTEEDWDIILDPNNRESFMTLLRTKTNMKKDPNTLVEIEEEEDNDPSLEVDDSELNWV